MASFLNVLIPVLVLGYAVFVIVRMRRHRGCSGCSGCPMAGKCSKEKKND
ncbi:MAG: FeoB-associated Cys-rich membrane protein [Clostridia bacterium]|nr:FeoB-associated Cys-rich membrane protein [Clostridia bacterium]MBR6570755.1 FeoB-associated Cys-rich membrane protein [Clostridia bacterium]